MNECFMLSAWYSGLPKAFQKMAGKVVSTDLYRERPFFSLHIAQSTPAGSLLISRYLGAPAHCTAISDGYENAGTIEHLPEWRGLFVLSNPQATRQTLLYRGHGKPAGYWCLKCKILSQNSFSSLAQTQANTRINNNRN